MKLRITAFLLLLSIFTWAQKTLSGKVTDQDGQPIPSASVTIEEPGKDAILAYAISNSKGEYKVSFTSSESNLDVKIKAFNQKGFYPNTELGIDLKLLTRKPGRLGMGEYLDGAITHDGEDHFTFVQNDSEKKKDKVVQRNPHVYEGTYINVNRKKDGTLYPTFNRPQFTEKFTFQDFCLQAAKELWVISGQEKGSL